MTTLSLPIPDKTKAVVSSICKSLLNTAPFTGGIASLWSDWESDRRFARVEHFINQLANELQRHSPRFKSEELTDAEMQLFEATLQRVSVEHREGKRCRFARLLASGWTN